MSAATGFECMMKVWMAGTSTTLPAKRPVASATLRMTSLGAVPNGSQLARGRRCRRRRGSAPPAAAAAP